MKYHNITDIDMKNGDGLRTVLWVSGCDHHCKDCQNPITWNPDEGLEFDNEAKEELFNNLSKDYISGITFSGGDPLFPSNRDTVIGLMKEIKEKFPSKTIWLYTGYLYEDIPTDILKYIDILIDGKFIVDKKDNNLPWKGSSNQRVIDVQKSIKYKLITLYC